MMYNNTMFFILENYQIGDRKEIKKAIKDIANKGFDAVLLQLRDTAFQLDDAKVINSVRIATDEAHKLGLKIYLTFITANCRPWYYSFFKKYPKEGEIHLYKAEGEIKKSQLKATILLPFNNTSPFVGRFEGIVATYVKKDSGFRKLPHFNYELDISRDAGIDKEGKWFVSPYRKLTITGKTRITSKEDVVLYVGIRDLNPDYASPLFDKFMDYLLKLYKDIPLDGVAWDEPGPPGSFNYYKISPDLCKAFKKEHNYDIRDRLYLLDYDLPNCGKVRYDYYLTLRNNLYQRQKFFVKKAKRLFGKNIFSGIHHTWRGEGTSQDLTCGAIDYFYLSKNLTGGFTDAGFSDEKSLIYTMRLAASIAKFHQEKEAYSNCWDFCPTYEKIVYFTRLMAIWRINWIGHSYGHGLGVFGPGYPYSHTWRYFPAANKRIRGFEEFIGEAKEHPSIAIYHSWESLARINSPFAHLHKTALINLTNILINENIPFDFVGEEQIGKSKIENRNLKINDENYQLLIIPWPNMLPPTVYKKLIEFFSSSGKIILFGPPMVELTDGKDVSKEFFSLLNIKPFTPIDYIAKYVEERGEVTERLPESDFFYPLTKKKKSFIKKDNLWYLSGVSPEKEILTIIQEANIPFSVETETKDIIYSLYEENEGFVFTVTGKYDKPFSGNFKIKGFQIRIREATLLGVKVKEGKVNIIGEGLKK